MAEPLHLKSQLPPTHVLVHVALPLQVFMQLPFGQLRSHVMLFPQLPLPTMAVAAPPAFPDPPVVAAPPLLALVPPAAVVPALPGVPPEPSVEPPAALAAPPSAALLPPVVVAAPPVPGEVAPPVPVAADPPVALALPPVPLAAPPAVLAAPPVPAINAVLSEPPQAAEARPKATNTADILVIFMLGASRGSWVHERSPAGTLARGWIRTGSVRWARYPRRSLIRQPSRDQVGCDRNLSVPARKPVGSSSPQTPSW